MLIGGMDILGLYCIDVNPSTAKQVDQYYAITQSLVKLFSII